MAMIFGLTFVLSLIAAYVFGMFLGNSMPLAGASAPGSARTVLRRSLIRYQLPVRAHVRLPRQSDQDSHALSNARIPRPSC